MDTYRIHGAAGYNGVVQDARNWLEFSSVPILILLRSHYLHAHPVTRPLAL
jgi:hypothetical protein